MSWDVQGRRWNEGLTQLFIFSRERGHMFVTATHVTSSGFPLGRWVSQQRAKHKAGRLRPEQREALENLGFIWDADAARFELGYRHLTRYREEHGDCLVPQRYMAGEYQLGKWVDRQRRKKQGAMGGLTPTQSARLGEASRA